MESAEKSEQAAGWMCVECGCHPPSHLIQYIFARSIPGDASATSKPGLGSGCTIESHATNIPSQVDERAIYKAGSGGLCPDPNAARFFHIAHVE